MNQFEHIKKLVEQRDKLLAEHPEYQHIQDKLTEALNKAGNRHNRAVVAFQAMSESLHELNQALQVLVKSK